MEIFNIPPPQAILVVTPAKASVPSVLSTHFAVIAGEGEHAAPVEPQTHCPLEQTLESVPVQSASAEH